MANLFVFSHSRRRRSFTSLTIAVFMVLWSGTCCTQSTASSSCELSASRFFEAGEYLHTVALASYPRSGNSFLRALLERATGFVTCARGSDPKLMALGFRGHRIDPLRPEQRHLCLVHKTHFPMNMQQLAQDLELFPGDDGAYSGAFDRVLMLVRNPFDVAFSSFHYFGPNNSHSSRRLLPDGSVEPLPSATARVHAAMWAKHVKFWLDRTSATVPSNVSSQASGHVASQDRLDSSRTEIGEDRFPERLIVRYEDLKKNPGHYIHAIAHWLGLSELNNDRVECTLSLKNNMVRFRVYVST